MIQVEAVRDLLLHLDCHKSMGPSEIYLRVLRELLEVNPKPISTICLCSWSIREVSEDVSLPSGTPIYQKS